MENKPIRILHYIGSLNVGGSQSMIMEIYRKIDRKKIQFDFIVDRKDELFFSEEILKMGGIVYTFDEYFKGTNYFFFVKQWKTFFEKHREYNVIHCHVRSVASIVLKIAKAYGLKTICHSHSISNGKGVKAVIKKILQTKINKYSDNLFACSMDAAVWLFGKKIAQSKKTFILNNAIDTKKFEFSLSSRNKIRKKYSISNETIVIGHVGRFVEVKNHMFIVDLIKKIKNSNKKIKFMFCGDGYLQESVKNEIKNLGLENYTIFVNNVIDVYNFYSAFDLLILPSLYEGLGMVLIEGQFSGLKCIASNKVPMSAKISSKLEFLELDVELWCKTILEMRDFSRDLNLLENARDYDIVNTISFLEKKYCNLHNERGEIK